MHNNTHAPAAPSHTWIVYNMRDILPVIAYETYKKIYRQKKGCITGTKVRLYNPSTKMYLGIDPHTYDATLVEEKDFMWTLFFNENTRKKDRIFYLRYQNNPNLFLNCRSSVNFRTFAKACICRFNVLRSSFKLQKHKGGFLLVNKTTNCFVAPEKTKKVKNNMYWIIQEEK
jgi:hypothetical protein